MEVYQITHPHHAQLILLYEAGYYDTQIEEIIGISSDDVSKWRKENDLPSQITRRSMKIKELYDQGLSDTAIAKEMEMTPRGIGVWRERNNLPCNPDPRTFNLENWQEGFNFYMAGLTDQIIAEQTGKTVGQVTYWRKKKNLLGNTSNAKKKKIYDFDENVAYELYNLGFSDIYIAVGVNTTMSTITRWRTINKLSPNIKQKHWNSFRIIENDSTSKEFMDEVINDPESLFNDETFIRTFIPNKK